MPIRRVAPHEVDYYLISFDAEGAERTDDERADGQEGPLSPYLLERVRAASDVFVLTHGWKGDVPAAVEQCDAWFGSLLQLGADVARAEAERPGFDPVLVGVHWPSQPFGDEEQPGGFDASGDGDASDAPSGRERVEAQLVAATADTEAARAAVEVLLDAADDDIEPDALPPEVVEAYRVLAAEIGVGGGGPGAPPGEDGEAFDAQRVYDQLGVLSALGGSFGGGGWLAGLLEPIRVLSFWKMKRRARAVGEAGVGALLAKILEASRGDARVHLMGHSFGCIVTSAAIATATARTDRRPWSAYLVQGAMSIWSFCEAIPAAPDRPGYFHPIVRDRLVAGPIVTTQSAKDTAVRNLYPIGAGAARMIDYAPDAELPKYGGLGTFGAHGPGVPRHPARMGPVDTRYGFRAGCLHDLEAGHVIREGGPPSGAHSDIVRPEVWHAFWEAALATA